MLKYFFFLLTLLPLPVAAQDAVVAVGSSAPLEITADKALEWNQTAKTYTAKVNAVAKQGALSVAADKLTAIYAGKGGSTSDMIRLEAEGHVVLTSGTDTATGDKAVYDLETGKAILTGAEGVRPKITQEGNKTLEADSVSVQTKDGAFEQATADGSVVITSGGQIITGDKAIYRVATTTAEIVGNVKMKQGDNWLQGDRAEINTQTHISKMIGQRGTGRVKGVFYPAKK